MLSARLHETWEEYVLDTVVSSNPDGIMTTSAGYTAIPSARGHMDTHTVGNLSWCQCSAHQPKNLIVPAGTQIFGKLHKEVDKLYVEWMPMSDAMAMFVRLVRFGQAFAPNKVRLYEEIWDLRRLASELWDAEYLHLWYALAYLMIAGESEPFFRQANDEEATHEFFAALDGQYAQLPWGLRADELVHWWSVVTDNRWWYNYREMYLEKFGAAPPEHTPLCRGCPH